MDDEWETSQENVGFKDDIGIAMGLEWDDKQQSSWDRTNSNGRMIVVENDYTGGTIINSR